MNIIDDKKVSLIAKLIISYALLLNFAFLFYIFNTDPGSDQTARGAVFTNLLVWTATLYTPIAAYLFYDSWKEQKKYELEKELLNQILNCLGLLFGELVNLRSNTSIIKSTDKYFAYYPKISSIALIDIYKTLHIMYSYMDTYCELTKDFTLIEKYNHFEKVYKLSFNTYNNIAPIYKEYIEVIETEGLNKIKDEHSTAYNEFNLSLHLKDKKSNLKTLLDANTRCETLDDNEIVVSKIKLTLSCLINESIQLNKNLKKSCVSIIENHLK